MSTATDEHPLGDLEPAFSFQLRQRALPTDTGATMDPATRVWTKPIDLTTAVRVTMLVWLHGEAEPALSRDATITVPSTGTGKLVWQSGDPVETVPGPYRILAVIMWPGTPLRPQTVPTRLEDAFTLRVTAHRP